MESLKTRGRLTNDLRVELGRALATMFCRAMQQKKTRLLTDDKYASDKHCSERSHNDEVAPH